MLNLENLEKAHFENKSGKTWNSQGILYNVHSSQGKVKENRLFSPYIIFIISFHSYSQSGCSMLLSVNVSFNTLHSAIANICTFPIF